MLALLDMRAQGFDVLLDVVGWLLVSVEGSAAALLVVAVLALLALEVWFVVALARVRDLPWLSADAPARCPRSPQEGSCRRTFCSCTCSDQLTSSTGRAPLTVTSFSRAE